MTHVQNRFNGEHTNYDLIYDTDIIFALGHSKGFRILQIKPLDIIFRNFMDVLLGYGDSPAYIGAAIPFLKDKAAYTNLDRKLRKLANKYNVRLYTKLLK
ncbi:MAG: hypothetical protein WHS82_02730 [Candidatus Methanosuratincola sp.]